MRRVNGLGVNWKVTIFSAACLVVFVCLGFWQLAREEEKIALLAAQERKREQSPVALARLPDSPEAHLREVESRGNYDPAQVFLLDNRVLDGVVGFEVLVPFREASSDQWALVNRGFVPMGRTRQDIPDIPAVAQGETPLVGRAWVGEYRAVAEGEFASTLSDRLTIVQVADPEIIGPMAGRTFFPHIVRLAESDPNALPRHWPVTVMEPRTHRAYAVQWFAMALAVIAAWGAFTFGRGRRTKERESE